MKGAPDAIGAAGVTVISPPLRARAAGAPSTSTEVTLSPLKSRLKALSDWVAVAEIVATAFTSFGRGRTLSRRS